MPAGCSQYENAACFFTGRCDEDGRRILLEPAELAKAKRLLVTAIVSGVFSWSDDAEGYVERPTLGTLIDYSIPIASDASGKRSRGGGAFSSIKASATNKLKSKTIACFSSSSALMRSLMCVQRNGRMTRAKRSIP